MDESARLTGEEQEILAWLARGYDVAGVAARVCYSRETIYARLRGIRDALGVRTDVGAVVEGLRLGVIGMPGQEEMAK